MVSHESILRFRSQLCVVLFITLVVGFSVPTLKAKENPSEAPGLEKPAIYEKFGEISEVVNRLGTAIGHPEQLQSAKDSLRLAWEGMQSEFSAEVSRLEDAKDEWMIQDALISKDLKTISYIKARGNDNEEQELWISNVDGSDSHLIFKNHSSTMPLTLPSME